MNQQPSVPSRDYVALFKRVSSLRACGWDVREVGKVCGMPLLSAERSGVSERPQVLLVGGLHGDEPAGVEAAVRWMESGDADRWPVDELVLPCLNPCGWVINQSLLHSGSCDHLLQGREQSERRYLSEVVEKHSTRTAWLPWQAEELTGPDALLSLASSNLEPAM